MSLIAFSNIPSWPERSEGAAYVFLLFPIRNINIIVKIELKKSGWIPERSEGHPN